RYRWACVQLGLGLIYFISPGDQIANLRKAIAFYQAALRVFSEAAHPVEWAEVQRSLGDAYTKLPVDNQAENLKRAIAYYEAALRIYTETDYPKDWMKAQLSLSLIHFLLPTSDRAEKLQRIIASLE